MDTYVHPEVALAVAKAMTKIKDPTARKAAKVKGTTKDGKPYEYEYFYADLADIYSEVREALAENGLFIDHAVRVDANQVYVSTSLVHSSGHCLPPIELGFRLPASIQDLGGITTYLRRYTLCLRLGIAAESDDDANSADKKQAETTTRRREPEPRREPQRRQEQAPPPVAPPTPAPAPAPASTPAPAPVAQPDHHPSFTPAVRAAFHARLGEIFKTLALPKATYDDVKAVCAAIDRPKPSQMDDISRRTLLDWLTAGGVARLVHTHYTRRLAELDSRIGRRLTMGLVGDWVEARFGTRFEALAILDKERIFSDLEASDSPKLDSLLSFQETQEANGHAPTTPQGAAGGK